LLATPVDDPELISVPLFDEPFWIAHAWNDPLNEKEEFETSDLRDLNLLLLSDGHCLTGQVMDLCGRSTGIEDDTADLRASSLETLLQLVGAGYGCTLIPALAIGGPAMTDMGVVARPLGLAGANRCIELVYRRSFPTPESLWGLAELISERLPNTVKRYTLPDGPGVSRPDVD
jgi:LysR family hydrogen peroxide-inducible transcriptional activator